MIADDLTGACDTGVMFARHGWRTLVLPAFPASSTDADLLVLSTDSRADTPDVAAEKTWNGCRFLREQGIRLLYKKIDSVLRGNIGAEVEAVMEQGAHPFAVITPAFPAM